MKIGKIEEGKNITKIRQRIKDGFYYSSTVIKIIAEKLMNELKLKN